MTPSFVKVMFSLIRKVPVCFSGSRECAYSNAHTVSYDIRLVRSIQLEHMPGLEQIFKELCRALPILRQPVV